MEAAGGGGYNRHRRSTSFTVRKTILYVLGIGVACFLVYHSSSHINYHLPISYRPILIPSVIISDDSSTAGSNGPRNSSKSNTSSSFMADPSLAKGDYETEEAKLEKILKEAAKGNNNTLIVTAVNAAWTKPGLLFDSFFVSLRIGNQTHKFINHLVVMALDQKSYNRCLEMHPYCYAVKTEGIDFSEHESKVNTPDYVRLVWRKIEIMSTVLKLGYNAIFTDTDILWFRDPFLHFLEDADMQLSSDHYRGSPTAKHNIPTTGFYYVKSNNRTIQFFKYWVSSRFRCQGQNDQDVFLVIRNDPTTQKMGIKIRQLDTAYYGGFCEPSLDLELVCLMHTNCCVGLGQKTFRLNMLIEEWRKYMALSNEERAKKPHTWPFRVRCHNPR